MPRLRRRGHALREISTLLQMQEWAATATEPELLEALEVRGKGEGKWGPICRDQACSEELSKRWRAWLDTATPETSKLQILAAARRFGRLKDLDEAKLLERVRYCINKRTPNPKIATMRVQ